jgi:hypothetical protein
MKLPQIQGDLGITKNSFYFGCDSLYFTKYGTVLANSLRIHAPWANIHCHIFNPTDEQLNWCKRKNLSVSYEFIDSTIREPNTYYACVRFIRVLEIFDPTAKIISLDCDSIAIHPLPEQKFIEDTKSTKVFWRTKGNKSLASTVLFGPDNVRVEYAKKLLTAFEDDSYKWFLDQDVMDEMISKNEFGITTDITWGSTSLKKKEGLIWTGKGDKKFSKEFQDLLEQYRNL